MRPTRTLATASLLACLLSACAPSPWYKGSSSALAPGMVPRDGMGRPVMKDGAMEYLLPPPAQTQPTLAARRDSSVIYFNDLRYADAPAKPAGAALAAKGSQPQP